MSKSLCTLNHLLVEELQGTAVLCLEIKNCRQVCQGEVAGTGAVRMPADEVRSNTLGEREPSARSPLMGL